MRRCNFERLSVCACNRGGTWPPVRPSPRLSRVTTFELRRCRCISPGNIHACSKAIMEHQICQFSDDIDHKKRALAMESKREFLEASILS